MFFLPSIFYFIVLLLIFDFGVTAINFDHFLLATFLIYFLSILGTLGYSFDEAKPKLTLTKVITIFLPMIIISGIFYYFQAPVEYKVKEIKHFSIVDKNTNIKEIKINTDIEKLSVYSLVSDSEEEKETLFNNLKSKQCFLTVRYLKDAAITNGYYLYGLHNISCKNI